jgi:Concanavalin A-like lectin/glucanases superfamily
MKINIFKPIPSILYVAAVSLLISSCQKSFDPKSYAPVQTFGGYATSSEIAPTNLAGYWAFDGNLVDSVSNTSGTNSGTSFTTGVKGQAMQGANNAYVLFNTTDAIKNLKAFTIAYWVNEPQNTAGIVGMVNLSDTVGFWGNIDMFFENGSTPTNALFKTHIFSNGSDAWLGSYDVANGFNAWVHFAVTYDGDSTFNVYVNGTALATSVQSGYGQLSFADSGPMVFGTVQFQTTPSLTSGSDSQPWASFMTGALDQVRIYNKALPDTDIKALYQLENLGR